MPGYTKTQVTWRRNVLKRVASINEEIESILYEDGCDTPLTGRERERLLAIGERVDKFLDRFCPDPQSEEDEA